MDLRPQAHEIIRTWLFSTVVRADAEFGTLPWTDAAISGWILDPDRKKMAKSKGNVVTPAAMLEEHGSDALRYWAASGRPGTDTAFDIGQMKIGRRLAIKILNASKFVFGVGVGPALAFDASAVTEPIDRALLARLADVVEDATRSFDDYNYTRALESAETFFWSFTDDYLELVKERAYGGRGDAAARSARVTLATAMSVIHRLFAPVLPFVTEEVWSWWQEGSIHRMVWPSADDVRAIAGDGDSAVLDAAGRVLSQLRKVKSENKVSMRTELAAARVSGPDAALAERAADDLRASGRIVGDLTFAAGDSDEPGVSVTLAPPDALPAPPAPPAPPA